MPRRADNATEAAVDWMVLLRSGSASATDRAAFDDWRNASADHAAAWSRVEAAVPSLPRGGTPAANATCSHAREILLRSPRRVVLKSLLGASLLAGLGGAAVNRVVPLRQLTADLYTGTGERRTIDLPDSSSLTLNARSAVDLRFTEQRRLVLLRTGAIVASVAADPLRPFSVQTGQGMVTALGTRFLVRQDENSTRVVVLEHQVEIVTESGLRRVLREGEGADFDAARIHMADVTQATGAEWINGHLLVNDQPLSEVVAELQRYRRGVLRVSPEAASIPVQGGFPLDDVDASLAGLADTLPIEIRDHGGWITLIDRR